MQKKKKKYEERNESFDKTITILSYFLHLNIGLQDYVLCVYNLL